MHGYDCVIKAELRSGRYFRRAPCDPRPRSLWLPALPAAPSPPDTETAPRSLCAPRSPSSTTLSCSPSPPSPAEVGVHSPLRGTPQSFLSAFSWYLSPGTGALRADAAVSFRRAQHSAPAGVYVNLLVPGTGDTKTLALGDQQCSQRGGAPRGRLQVPGQPRGGGCFCPGPSWAYQDLGSRPTLMLTNVISLLESQFLACKLGTGVLLLQVAHVPELVPQEIYHGLLKPTEFQRAPLLEPVGVVRLLLPRGLEGRRRNAPTCQELRLLSPGVRTSMTNWKLVGWLSVISAPGGFLLQGTRGLEKPLQPLRWSFWDIKWS